MFRSIVVFSLLISSSVAFAQRRSGPVNNSGVDLSIRVLFENSRPAGEQLRVQLTNQMGLPLGEMFTDSRGEARFGGIRPGVYRAKISGMGIQETTSDSFVIDPLAMTVGADTEAVTTTLETIRLIRERLGVNMCLGASNVSFGLPERHVLNAAFLPMAMDAGLTSAIMSTAEVCVQSVRAADLLLGHDAWGASWIAAHRQRRAAATP